PEERISDDGFSKFPSRYLSREESEAPPVNAPMAGIKQYRGKDTFPEGSSYQEQLKKGFAKQWRTEMDDILDEEVWTAPATQEDTAEDTPKRIKRPREESGPAAAAKKEWYEPRTATGYIDVKNPKVIPKGTWKWTYLGRPDTVRPLKPKRRFDMADLVNASDIHPRNWRKKASDETWREAKRHWVEWARRRKLVGKAYQIPKEAMTKEEVDARSQIDQAQGLIREKKEVVHDAVSDLKQQLRRKRERVR
ncbi:(ABC) transporter, partial [Perkinsus olseni]